MPLTKAQAKSIILVANDPDIEALVEIEEKEYEEEALTQLARNFTICRDEFMYYQGLIQGMNRMRFKERLKEAKKLLKKEGD